ncbi:hypothetical protein EVG20_g4157 [Dentipellis fragilis]|uniref:RanBD1 domain-containing protein n=1 Tax=Dentipellis fragilis TaxID=205917 RepID=A0A4Y9YWG8_9AGAM|nr:hypothetical protein EVG20_g4157 [Dentipellis fragilis]
MAPSDAPVLSKETHILDTQRSVSPPLPSPNTNENGEVRPTDAKIPQKRERELSQEPATPRTDDLDSDPERSRRGDRDLRTPAKKNRTQLGVTQEEEGEDDAPVSGSPPHETKMRQISQGVEDINWKNKQLANKNAIDRPSTPLAAPDALAAAGVETPTEHADTGASPPAAPQSVPVPPSPQPSIMDIRPDGEPHVEPPTTKTSKSSSRRGSESESETERNLKRKLADRAASQGPVDEPTKAPKETKTRRESADLGTAKRPRDDADKDDNPRETKRPSPPPDKLGTSASPSTSKPDATSEHATPAPAPALVREPPFLRHPPAADQPRTPPQAGGFLAYASNASPFASVKGPNLFASGKSASTSTAPAPWPSTSRASPGPGSSVFGGAFTSSSPPTAGSPSPFASARFSPAPAPAQTPREALRSPGLARSKSPVRRGTPAASVSVFSAYAAGGAQGFAVPVAKRARAGSPGDALGLFAERRSESVGGEPAAGAEDAAGGSGGSGRESKAGSRSREGSEESITEREKEATFGERLRAGKIDHGHVNGSEGGVLGERKVELTEHEVFTGEEDEETVHHVRGKLFVLSEQNQWRERGTGIIRLNVQQTDGGHARLGEHLLYFSLHAALATDGHDGGDGSDAQGRSDPRYLRFSVIEDGVTTHYNLRVGSAKAAAELLADIQANIPGATPEP